MKFPVGYELVWLFWFMVTFLGHTIYWSVGAFFMNPFIGIMDVWWDQFIHRSLPLSIQSVETMISTSWFAAEQFRFKAVVSWSIPGWWPECGTSRQGQNNSGINSMLFGALLPALFADLLGWRRLHALKEKRAFFAIKSSQFNHCGLRCFISAIKWRFTDALRH